MLWCVLLLSSSLSPSPRLVMSNGELEQTHFVAGKVFVFQVPKLESSEGFKSTHHDTHTQQRHTHIHTLHNTPQ